MVMKYKPLMLIPTLMLIGAVAVLVAGYMQTGEWFIRSIELKGGTLITINGAGNVDELKEQLSEFQANVRKVAGFGGEKLLIEVPSEVDAKDVLNSLAQKGYVIENANIQTVGPALGESFWQQTQIAIVISFILMGMVIFFVFRNPASSIAVIFSAVADIIETFALMQIFSVELSLATLGAILMLIGYSVDTEVLLSSRMKRIEGELGQRVKNAAVTGLTMTFTAIGTLAALVVSGISPVISQIAIVLLFGLIVDIPNSWLMNAGILRVFMERRKA